MSQHEIWKMLHPTIFDIAWPSPFHLTLCTPRWSCVRVLSNVAFLLWGAPMWLWYDVCNCFLACASQSKSGFPCRVQGRFIFRDPLACPKNAWVQIYDYWNEYVPCRIRRLNIKICSSSSHFHGWTKVSFDILSKLQLAAFPSPFPDIGQVKVEAHSNEVQTGSAVGAFMPLYSLTHDYEYFCKVLRISNWRPHKTNIMFHRLAREDWTSFDYILEMS